MQWGKNVTSRQSSNNNVINMKMHLAACMKMQFWRLRQSVKLSLTATDAHSNASLVWPLHNTWFLFEPFVHNDVCCIFNSIMTKLGRYLKGSICIMLTFVNDLQWIKFFPCLMNWNIWKYFNRLLITMVQHC